MGSKRERGSPARTPEPNTLPANALDAFGAESDAPAASETHRVPVNLAQWTASEERDLEGLDFFWPEEPTAVVAHAGEVVPAVEPWSTPRSQVETPEPDVAPERYEAPDGYHSSGPYDEREHTPPVIVPHSSEVPARPFLTRGATLATAAVVGLGIALTLTVLRQDRLDIRSVRPDVAHEPDAGKALPTTGSTVESPVPTEAKPSTAPTRALGTIEHQTPSDRMLVPAPRIASGAPAPPAPVQPPPPSPPSEARNAPVTSALDSAPPFVATAMPVTPAAAPGGQPDVDVRVVTPLGPSDTVPPPVRVVETLPAPALPPTAPSALEVVSNVPPAVPVRIEPSAARPSNAAERRGSDEGAVQSVLEGYRVAYNQLNAAGAKAVWPSVDVATLSKAFDQLESQDIRFSTCQVNVSGDTAQATCGGSAAFVPKIGDRTARHSSRQWSFVLRRSGDRWVIAGLKMR